MTARRLVPTVVGSMVVLGAAAILLWSAVTTSTARLSASTGSSGAFAAGTVDLIRSEGAVTFLFDADGLYPGRVVTSCVEIDYEGSVEADLRLHALRTGGTSLEDHVDIRLWTRSSGACPDAVPEPGSTSGEGSPATAEPDSATAESDLGSASSTARPARPPIFEGLLGDLWRDHPTYADGLGLVSGAGSGDRLILLAEVELTGGDAAQGLTTEFTVTVEARPR